MYFPLLGKDKGILLIPLKLSVFLLVLGAQRVKNFGNMQKDEKARTKLQELTWKVWRQIEAFQHVLYRHIRGAQKSV